MTTLCHKRRTFCRRLSESVVNNRQFPLWRFGSLAKRMSKCGSGHCGDCNPNFWPSPRLLRRAPAPTTCTFRHFFSARVTSSRAAPSPPLPPPPPPPSSAMAIFPEGRVAVVLKPSLDAERVRSVLMGPCAVGLQIRGSSGISLARLNRMIAELLPVHKNFPWIFRQVREDFFALVCPTPAAAEFLLKTESVHLGRYSDARGVMVHFMPVSFKPTFTAMEAWLRIVNFPIQEVGMDGLIEALAPFAFLIEVAPDTEFRVNMYEIFVRVKIHYNKTVPAELEVHTVDGAYIAKVFSSSRKEMIENQQYNYAPVAAPHPTLLALSTPSTPLSALKRKRAPDQTVLGEISHGNKVPRILLI